MPDSPAERSGQLFIGDHLLAVNNQDVSNMDHGDIVGLIKRSGLSIRLLVQQPQSKYNYDCIEVMIDQIVLSLSIESFAKRKI